MNNDFLLQIDEDEITTLSEFITANTTDGADIDPVELKEVTALQVGESTCAGMCQVTRIN